MSQLYELWKKLKHKLADRQFLLSLLPALLIALYLAGLLIHAAYNGVRIMFSANTSAEPIWNWNPFVAISSVFSPFGIFLIAFVCGMVFLFSGRARELLTGEKTDKDQRGFEILHDGLHGTSGWMTKEEQTHTLQVGKAESLSGTLIGKMDAEGSGRIAAVSDQLYMSGHVIVYGASGSGKTRGFTLPLILQKIELFGNARKESMVVVDPKGDLFQKTSARAKERGFFVRALNLLDPAYSDSFNCLADVEEDAGLVNIIADTIIATTSSKFEKSDFWAKAEKNLLMALIWYVVLLEDPETHKRLPIQERSLGTIYKLLSEESFNDLDARFAQLPAKHPALPPYGIFKLANRQILGNIAIGLGNRLSVFQDTLINKITSYNDLDITLPGKQPCIYYCIISDHDSSMEFISSLFFSIMFTRLMAVARRDTPDGRLPIRVNMLLEEFCNVYLPSASRLLSVVRSRNIACQLLVQSVAQLQDRYPQGEWEEIVSNCSTQLVLGVNDVTTATYISKKCGMVTVRTNSTVSPQLPPLSFLSSGASANRYSQSCSEAQRPLMLPDEVEHMDKARCLALISGRRPVMLYKLIPEELPGFDKMGLVKISDYKPHWKEKDAQYQKTAAAPQVHIPSAGSHSVPCNPLSHPAFRTDGTSQLQIPMESRETYHYELPRQQKKPSPAAEDRVGNMRRYTAQEVLAQTRCKATPNTGEVPPRKKDEII